MKDKYLIKKILYIIIFLFSFNVLMAIESKIIFKIENEIITNVDIKNEFKYLSALNNQLQNLDKEKIFNISKNSIIREKIKKIEILNNFKTLEIDQRYLKKIVENVYKRRNIKSLEEFKRYLADFSLTLRDVEEKLKIDALWRELIIKKYASKIEIDVEEIEKEIKNNNYLRIKSYLLSEIIFEIKSNNELNSKYIEIKKSIEKIGFENTSSIYSISETAKIGGKIGWISEQSLNKQIKKEIISLQKGKISKPFIIPGGVLILKMNDIKEEDKDIDHKLELDKAVRYEKNKQLNQYSKIYFNKIKKNLTFND